MKEKGKTKKKQNIQNKKMINSKKNEKKSKKTE